MAAADELNVSPAAVSQQVRNLETFFRRKLFTRLNNRIVLTDAGQAIHAGITPALEDIAALTHRVLAGSSRAKLVVSVIPSLAECWFMPAFAGFAESAALRIDLRIADDPVDFAAGEIDLRIIYGSAAYPGLRNVPLFRDEVLPLCRPETRRAHRAGPCGRQPVHPHQLGAGLRLPSLMGRLVRRFLPVAPHRPREGPPRRLIAAGARLRAARPRHRARPARTGGRKICANGRLVALDEQSLPLGHDYCAVYPRGQGAEDRPAAAYRFPANASAASVIASHAFSAKVRIT